MKLPLMPKATAIWLIDNTSLSFNQIADFCGLHELEVQGIADGDVATGMQGYDPIDNKQLTREEITRCENDKTANLELIKSEIIESLPPRKKILGIRRFLLDKKNLMQFYGYLNVTQLN